MRCPLHLSKGAIFDLPDPLARDSKSGSELVERAWLIEEPAPLEDFQFALIEHAERHAQRLPPDLRLLAFGNT